MEKKTNILERIDNLIVEKDDVKEIKGVIKKIRNFSISQGRNYMIWAFAIFNFIRSGNRGIFPLYSIRSIR